MARPPTATAGLPTTSPATGPDRPPQPISRRMLFGIFLLLHRQAWLPELLPVTILPAALAFIVVAGLRLGRDVFRPSPELLLATAAFLGATLLGLNPVVLLLAGGAAGTVLLRPKGDQA